MTVMDSLTADGPRRAGLDEVNALAHLAAEACGELGITAWLVPFALERARILPGYFRILLEHAMVHGVVYALPDLSGVAGWLPAGSPDVLDHDQRIAGVCGVATDRFRTLDTLMTERRPSEPPHDHLVLLAVHPDRQHTGLGSLLLAHRHRVLDALNQSSYLEAPTMRAARLFARHGYRHSSAPFGPADCAASLWPMWRDTNPTQPTRPRS